eukprot:scaffold80221_cov26-Prasinocladus_malaysianus.AAC.1
MQVIDDFSGALDGRGVSHFLQRLAALGPAGTSDSLAVQAVLRHVLRNASVYGCDQIAGCALALAQLPSPPQQQVNFLPVEEIGAPFAQLALCLPTGRAANLNGRYVTSLRQLLKVDAWLAWSTPMAVL